MINLEHETIVTLAEAAKTLPRLSSSGKPVSPATLWRWAYRGLRHGKVKLETIRVGGRTATSVQALERFFAALQPATAARALPRTPTQRQRAAEQAGEGLSRLGI